LTFLGRRLLMDEHENTFPLDVYTTDPSSLPWNFRPEGYLVVILSDAGEAQRAEAAVVANGFASEDVKLYTGKQILANYEEYTRERGVTSKVVGSVADDIEGRELYVEYARDDRSAMWVRIPNEDHVPKALRVLADFHYLHARYYGHEKQTDFHIS
jgi:hypothetical protein